MRKLDRVTVGATIAVVAIAFVNLMHFSQGWVQFGYRFSNDFAPFADRAGRPRRRPTWPLLAGWSCWWRLSIVVNFWGTIWGVTLGW